MGKLAEKLNSNQKVMTAEVTPPKGAGIKKLTKNVEMLAPLVDALNVTDCQRALVKMSSLAACRILLDKGVEPVYQLTCRDRNTIALQSDLMGASALGIPNVLCLTGDPVKVGDSTQSKSVFEVESTALLSILQKLQSGTDAGGNKMNAPTKLFIGAVVNPTLSSNQMDRMKKKIENGAQFFQTQANYDISDFKNFLAEAKKFNTKIIAGILILHTKEIAEFISDNIPGISLPPEILKRFQDSSNPEQTGIEVALETMQTLKDHADGFHLMSIRYEEIIPKVLEAYGKIS